MNKRKEITDIVEERLAKELGTKEADEQVKSESEHKSAKNLRKIGAYIIDRRQIESKVPKGVDKTTKRAYDDAVSFIDANEKDMAASNDDQKRVYTQVKDSLIKVRSSSSYEELETRRKNLEFLKKLNNEAAQNPDDLGEVNAKNYIEKLINKIHTESKPSKSSHLGYIAKKSLFSQEGTMLGNVIDEFKFVGDMLKVIVPGLKKTSQGDDTDAYDDEIRRLSQVEKSTKAKYSPAKQVDPGIAPKKTAPELVAPAKTLGQEPIKIGNQKIYPDDPMYNKIMGQSKVTPATPAEPAPISSKPSAEAKTSTLTVDKLIAKSVIIEKQVENKTKPHIKLKSGSSVENKPFKTELFGEEPVETKSTNESGILDTIKNAILGGALGKKLAGTGRIGAALRTGASAGMTGLTAAAPPALLALATQQAETANMNNEDQTNIFSSVARFGKSIADKWNSFTGGPNKDAQIKRIQENIEERGVKYSPAEAREIKETLGYTVPESALSMMNKPTMIERSATDIPKATEKVEQKAKELGAAPVIIQNSPNVQAQPAAPTIVPLKGSIRPSESAFSRFQDKNFKQ